MSYISETNQTNLSHKEQNMKNAINNKKLLLPLIITIVLVLLLALTACSFINVNDDDNDKTITYENVVFKDGNAIIEVDGHPTPSNFIPEKEGYIFRYWITEFGNKNSVFEQNEYKGEAITLYAVWKAKEFKVKFVDYDGKVLQVNGQDEQLVEYNTAAIAPTEPTRYGYNFIGWDSSFDQIKKETIITAKYERKATTVSFYYGTELLSQKQIYIGDKINVGETDALKALSKFTAEGLELEGWYADSGYNSKIIMSEATATENMNIFANLKVAHLKGITLETQNSDNTFEYAEDLTVTVSVNFTEFQNIFYSIKWYLDGSEYDGANKIILLEGLTVGKHTVKAVIRSSFGSDYVEDEKSISIIVNKASMYVKANDITIKYGDPLPAFSYSTRNRNSNVFGEAEYSCNYKVGSDVGTYAILITKLESDLYKLIFEEGTLTVEPKPITVRAADQTVVYGDDIPNFSYECGDLLNNDSLGIASFETNYTKGSSVGEYSISLSGLTNKNYDITSYEVGILTVKKMELSFKVVCDNTVYYGDDIPEFGYKITKGSLLEGDSLGTPRYNCEYVKGSDSGRYSVRMTGLRNPNYDFQTSTSAWFQVLPKTVNLTWNTKESYTYNGLDQGNSISATFTDINGNLAVASIAFNGNGTVFKDAGVYNVLASYSNTNYNITNAVLQVEIEKLVATVTIDDVTVTYGDDIPNYTYSIEGLLEGESLGALNFDCDYAKGSEVGKYPLQGTGLTNSNYDITYNDAVLSVEKKRVNVDWVYSDSYTYTGEAQSNTIYAKFVRYDGRNTNLVLSYKLNGVISDFKTAGTYTITANSQDKNYELIGVERTITIAPKDVHIVFEDRVITYGDEIPSFSHEIVGLVDGETPSYLGSLNYICDYVKNANTGDYIISGENLNNSNYNIIYDSAILRVNKKSVTAVWDYQDSYTYNGATQDETVTAKFMQTNGEYKYMDISFACGDNTDFYHVGTYNVTASSVDEINYDIQDKQKSLTILKARVEVIVDSLYLTYGENVPEFSHRVVGLFDGDSLGTLSYTCDYTKGSPVNDYPITVDGYQNSDYDIVYTNATLTCTHREVSVTWETLDSYIYNRLDQSESVKAIFVNYNGEREEANIEFTSGETKVFKKSGEYSLVATVADTNYILKNNTTNLTINKKAVEINVQDVVATYGDENVEFIYEVIGVIDGDVIDTSIAFTYTQGTAVGSYPLNIEYTPNNNYAVTVNAGLFTLNKRPVTVEWVIGEYTYNGLERASEVSATFTTYDGNKLNMDVSFQGTASVFKNAGSYTLSASYIDQNYEYQNVTQTAEIAKKDLVISVDNKTIEYGDAASFTYTQVGLVENDSFGNFTFSSDYTVGSAVNSYTITILGANNDNYNITINDAVLTVNPKIVSLTWDYQEYTYNGSDLSSTVKCYYPSYTGENVNMALSLSGDYNEFKNAGRYSFTAINNDTNYIVNGQMTVELVINKADYQNITHNELSGTYDPNKTLSDYVLGGGFRWKNANTTPTVKVSDYPAIYNADSINYNDYSLTIKLSIEKANYTDVSNHTALAGTYDPNKKLSSYSLNENYYWNTPDTLPTVNVTEYAAYYNTDRDNYNDYPLSIRLILAKADYQNVMHRELSGTYNPDSTLNDYALDNDFAWVKGDTKPIVKQNKYDAVYNADSVNYNDYRLTITLNIAKADYQNITHEGFSGIYNPDKALASYTLNANYAWVDSTKVPSVDVTAYSAKYNADSDNYNDYIFNITITLEKANYTNVAAHTALSGVYSGQQLSAYTLSAGYYWVDASVVPVVNKTVYSAYYNVDKVNYNDYPVTITLTLQKGTYTGITHNNLTGVYSPTKTLASYTLNSGFAWNTPSIVPTCDVKAYNATYNADPDNYNTLNLTVQLVLTKATVSLEQTSWSYDYDGNAKTITPAIIYNGAVLDSSNYSLTYSIGNSFTDGGVYKTKITMSSQNYQLPSSGSTCTVSIKSVITSSSSTLTTLESALSSMSSGTIIVKYNTRLYGDATVKSGVTLLIPYDSTHDTTINLTVASGGAPSSAYSTLKIMNGATLTVNGSLNVSGRQVTNTGHTTGTYGCMDIETTGYVDVYGKLYCLGFITGSGEVYLNSGAEGTESLQIKDWPGGTIAYTVYKEFFPFSQFLIANIEAKLTVPYGAKLNAHYTITASDKEFVGDLLMFGQGGLFETTDATNGSFTKMLDPETGKVTITAYGAVKTNNISISISVSIASVDMETKGKEIPIPGYYNIVMGEGSTVTLDSKFKLLPGASLTINRGAVCNISSNGGLIGYDATYSNVYTNYGAKAYGGSLSASNTRLNKQVYQPNSPVTIVVDGTLNCSGVIGGTFTTTVAGSHLNLSGASAVSGTIISHYEMTSEKEFLSIKLKHTKYTYNYTAKSNGVTLGKSNYTGKANGYFA